MKFGTILALVSVAVAAAKIPFSAKPDLSADA